MRRISSLLPGALFPVCVLSRLLRGIGDTHHHKTPPVLSKLATQADAPHHYHHTVSHHSPDHRQHHHEKEHHDKEDLPPPAKQDVKIRVVDSRGATVAVQPIKRFSDIAEDLPEWLNQGIAASGFKAPMAVQSIAIPLLLEERDLVGIAPTGSGKTVAFAVPALSSVDVRARVRSGNRCDPSVLVLCPTRELCQQTHTVFRSLGVGQAIAAAAFGGADRDRQADVLCRGADVVVATPGRLCDFLDSGIISLDVLNFLVLDEADRMLEMGFATQLNRMMDCINPDRKRRTMMWSATWASAVEKLANNFMSSDRLMVTVDAQQTANRDITQHVYAVLDPKDRVARIVKLIDDKVISQDHKIIVFANQKETVDNLAEDLARELRVHWSCVQPLHGGLRQAKRDAIIRNFKDGAVRILVATDVAARGLDVKDVDHVVNYDLPSDTDAFVHRVGRTGRAGRQGQAHTLFVQGVSCGVMCDIAEALQKDGVKLSPDVLSVLARSMHYSGGNEKKHKKYVDHSRLKGHGDWKAWK
jgi:ATP-dependent RNA helicase DDX5/DBP2